MGWRTVGQYGCTGRRQMKRKVIGIGVVAVLAAAILFGTVGSVLEVVAATARNPGGEYAARLTGGPEDGAALAALKYVCPFH